MLIAVLVAELLVLKKELSATMSYLLPAIICGRSASSLSYFKLFIYQSHALRVASRHARNIDHMHKAAALDVTQKPAQPRASVRPL